MGNENFYDLINFISDAKRDKKITLEEAIKAEDFLLKIPEPDKKSLTQTLISEIEKYGSKEAKKYFKIKISLDFSKVKDIFSELNVSSKIKNILTENIFTEDDYLKLDKPEQKETLIILNELKKICQKKSSKSRAGINKYFESEEQIDNFILNMDSYEK